MDRISFGKSVNLGYGNPEELDYEYLGRFKGLEVWINKEETGYMQIEVIDPSIQRGKRNPMYKRVMEIELSTESFKKAFHVNCSRMDKKYQGGGLSFRIYRYLLTKIPNLIIQAGNSQSPGGRYIWYKLSQFKDVLVYGKTKTGRPAIMIPDDEKREMTCYNPNKVAYDGDKDFYMFAVKCA